jgi:hypothetical protein
VIGVRVRSLAKLLGFAQNPDQFFATNLALTCEHWLEDSTPAARSLIDWDQSWIRSGRAVLDILRLMAQFTTRVELNGVTWQDYENLLSAMELKGFSRTITAHDGITYLLPTAEYNRTGQDLTTAQVLNDAKAAASSVAEKFSILVTEASARMWLDLPEHRPLPWRSLAANVDPTMKSPSTARSVKVPPSLFVRPKKTLPEAPPPTGVRLEGVNVRKTVRLQLDRSDGCAVSWAKSPKQETNLAPTELLTGGGSISVTVSSSRSDTTFLSWWRDGAL